MQIEVLVKGTTIVVMAEGKPIAAGNPRAASLQMRSIFEALVAAEVAAEAEA